jgi:hypothetical protein
LAYILKRAEVSGEEDATGMAAASAITTLAGVDADADTESTEVGSTTTALLGLGSFLSCLDATSSETVAVTVAVTVGSTEVAAEEVLDVLTILSDYTHISSVFLSSFQYILYIVNLYLFLHKIT